VGYEDDVSQPGSGRFFVRDPGAGNQQAMTYAEAKARLCDLLWFEATTSRGDSSSLKREAVMHKTAPESITAQLKQQLETNPAVKKK
jgi:isocitrate lyase